MIRLMRVDVCAAWLIYALTANSFSAAAQEIERPTWTIGDAWRYQRTEGPSWDNPGIFHFVMNYEVVETRPNQYRAQVTKTAVSDSAVVSSENWGITRNLNFYYRANPQLPWTEIEYLRWPLAVGKEWSFEYPGPDGSVWVEAVRVDRWEEVTVPAGRFKAIVVEIRTQAHAGTPYGRQITIWYAPEAKARVREEATGIYKGWRNRTLVELESYKLK